MARPVLRKNVDLRRLGWKGAIAFCAVLLTGVAACAADPSERVYIDRFAGVMTQNRWHDVFDPSRVQLADSILLGVGIGWQRQIAQSRFHFGIEVQAVAHAGRQDHFEFNLPVVLRYVPRRPFPRQLKSAAFALGLSHATKVPQVELDRTGESQRTFAYWFGELEFSLPDPQNSLFLRLHHRSDAYGFFDADSGSTAVTFGLRVPF
ncbi:hypothetical protein [Sulfitobacter sp. JB4-11]|uniref:hypothetical protein n=1 Tax=Sulfitobacter rhodophyticola TaxID=3238304 RepID=UPI003D81B6B3